MQSEIGIKVLRIATDDPFRIWNGIGEKRMALPPYETAEAVYYGVGDVLGWPDHTTSAALANRAEYGLAATRELIAKIMDQSAGIIGRKLVEWRGRLTADQATVYLDLVFVGAVLGVRAAWNGPQAEVRLVAASGGVSGILPAVSTLTPAFRRLIEPETPDRGFDFVPTMTAGRQIEWTR